MQIRKKNYSILDEKKIYLIIGNQPIRSILHLQFLLHLHNPQKIVTNYWKKIAQLTMTNQFIKKKPNEYVNLVNIRMIYRNNNNNNNVHFALIKRIGNMVV